MKGLSTSWHKLSADRRLSKPQRILWIAFNLFNNALPRIDIDERVRELKFCLAEHELDELWDRIADTSSPSRRLCDLFWMSLPWPAISTELTAASVVEVGCGSGVYGRLLERTLGECFRSYVGIDIKSNEQWKDFDAPRFRFEVGTASDARRFLLGANLILTQSALEHFEDDLLYFRQVSMHVLGSKYPILQVHLMPSASCITTFPWHGIREYTPRTVSKITRLFGIETKPYLFWLGGSRCNQIHRKFITWPLFRYGVDLRYAESAKYLRSLRSAILDDFRGGASNPAFYALVLASNFKSDPFALGVSK